MCFKLIGAVDIDSYIGNPSYIILDLRDYKEYMEAHIETAHNLPYRYFDAYVSRLPKDKIYIVYCHYGALSMLAAKQMAYEGFKVFSLSGGFEAYKRMKR